MPATSRATTAERRRDALRTHTERLAAYVAAAANRAAVPTCPGWTVADLVAHVGQTQRWVSEIIERRIADPTQLPTHVAISPTEPDAWPTWLTDGGARAVEACSDEAMTADVFNAAGDDRTGGQFWLDSLLNEAVIHGADAAYAAGQDVEIDADIAADLISNHLAMLTSPTWAARRPESAIALHGDGETLSWHATDVPAGQWFIERRPDGARWQPRTGEADVSIDGPASTLLLVLTRRRPLTGEADGLSVAGELDLVRHWIDHTEHVSG